MTNFPSNDLLKFQAIIYVTAKQLTLDANGIWPISQVQSTLRDIFHVVARVLGRDEISRAAPSEQAQLVRHALAQQRTLLIVDNLETIQNQREVLEFLHDLPPTVKVIVTTRERSLLYAPIQLDHLPDEDALKLVQHETGEKNIVLAADDETLLVKRTGGVPAAIIYAVGQIAAGYRLQTVLHRLANHEGDVARFCFKDSVNPLRNTPAYDLLLSVAIFHAQAPREKAIEVANLNSDLIEADDALVKLLDLSLIREREGRFAMLPLTREYCLAELAANPEFESEVRKRWIKCYLTFAEKLGGDDWIEWHIPYDYLEEDNKNLFAVIEWCQNHHLYDEVKAFWQFIGGFTRSYGHWDFRLIVLDWLIPESERRADWPVAVEAMYQKAWTLSIMGRNIEEASQLLQRAWNLREQVPPILQSYLADYWAEHIGRHHDENNLSEAYMWLERSAALVEQCQNSERLLRRKQVNTLYCFAMVNFKGGQLQQAQTEFENVQTEAERIGWQRLFYYAQNYLADIAIVQHEFGRAEELLQSGLPVVERNKDKRRIAYYKRSFAKLEFARGDQEQARDWINQSIEAFEKLGMQPEAIEMRQLLKTLDLIMSPINVP